MTFSPRVFKNYKIFQVHFKSVQEDFSLFKNFTRLATKIQDLVHFQSFNFQQLDMISQGKVSRGVSYSPKVSTAAPSMPKNITEGGASSSKWSRVRNAFLNKDESLTLEESMSMPSSPTQKTSSFFGYRSNSDGFGWNFLHVASHLYLYLSFYLLRLLV